MLLRPASMPRTVIRKTNRGNTPIHVLRRAANLVINEDYSLRDASEVCGVSCHVSLFRFVKQLKLGNVPTTGYKSINCVFSKDQEKVLEEYIVKAAERYYGFGPTPLRKLAYQLAVKFSIKYPIQWDAGKHNVVNSVHFTCFNV